MNSGLYLSTVGKFLNWSRANSLWFTATGGGCCADELLNSVGCRYDLERFGCLEQPDPRQADLLFVTGALTYRGAPALRALYDQMLEPKYVIAVGSCASCGGLYGPELSYSVVPGADRIIPVDVYVPGCPPRPEALMSGLLALQDKIQRGA